MSSQPVAAANGSAPSLSSLSRPQAAGLSAILAVVGVASILSTGYYLWALWTTDPLKSIGGFIPLVSFVLILRVWRSTGWVLEGSWWGLVILAATIAVVHLRDHAIIEFILSPSWSIFLPPHSLVAFAYTAGVVLLFGGPRLFRAALFPIVLMWFVNPVPHTFNLWVDLPLQHASAFIARGFAHALGQQLTSDQLRLMFTPDFGMFIAPGCNGIRGAVTMGFIALIAGYIYRFRPRVWAAVTAGAVLLGYVFNFARLCVLVLYYLVALRITWLQSRAEMGDYIIGACLFFIATLLLFSVIRRFNATHDLRPPKLPAQPGLRYATVPPSFYLRWTAALLVFAVGSVTYARAFTHNTHAAPAPAESLFPATIGSYKLDRTWNETLVTGALIFNWADYRSPSGNVVSVGISPVLGAHDTLLCHSARGEDWLWHGDITLPTATGPTSFSGSFFNDGAIQYLEATTLCTGAVCGQYTSSRRHFGFVYSRPDTHALLTQDPTRPIPVLLRTETLDTALAPDTARNQLTATLHDFLSAADLARFTQPIR
jgi:exosortase J